MVRQGTNIVVRGTKDKKQYVIPVNSLTEKTQVYVEKAQKTRTDSGAKRGEWVVDERWDRAEREIIRLTRQLRYLQRDGFTVSRAALVDLTTETGICTTSEFLRGQIRRSMDLVIADIQRNRAVQAEIEESYKRKDVKTE